MKVRAAVAHASGQPLRLETVDLEGPRAGEVLVELKATGVCHTDAYTLSGKDPEGLFPTILGHEGAGVVVEVGRGRPLAAPGRPRDPALHPRVPGLRILPQPQDQPVPGHPRHPGQRPDARRDQPVLDGRRAGPALHGDLDLRQLHRGAGDRRWPRSAPTPRSTRSATSAAASPPASARSSTPPRSSPGRAWSCSGWAASGSTSSRAPAWPAPTGSSAST